MRINKNKKRIRKKKKRWNVFFCYPDDEKNRDSVEKSCITQGVHDSAVSNFCNAFSLIQFQFELLSVLIRQTSNKNNVCGFFFLLPILCFLSGLMFKITLLLSIFNQFGSNKNFHWHHRHLLKFIFVNTEIRSENCIDEKCLIEISWIIRLKSVKRLAISIKAIIGDCDVGIGMAWHTLQSNRNINCCCRCCCCYEIYYNFNLRR